MAATDVTRHCEADDFPHAWIRCREIGAFVPGHIEVVSGNIQFVSRHIKFVPGDMIQLEDPSHEHVEAFQDDGVWHEVKHWDMHVLAGPRKRARAKRIKLAMQMMLLHVHGGLVELLGRLEQEATTVHILEIYLEDDPSSKG
ncbi:hypothetical protein CRG98_011379 [Punica granatum]|uniref:Uncharacterized protein n=1 Tax=Punica granatum TaxID=22663 RepID=A0A2I0KJ64_PUNGR|nr:hypothetical protein CRG98_011379 [Punica granatum]